MFGIDDFSKSIVDFSNFDASQLGDALLFGGAILLIGMVTVFAVLCLLWACLVAFQFFFHDLPEKRTKSAPKTVSAVSAPGVQSVPVQSSNDEIVAVIAAAIAAAESESNGMKFRVVSFKRK